jgi:large subunit ribosomal protein L6
MSRIGKHAVIVPQGVEVKVEGQVVSAKGKLGQSNLTIMDDLKIEFADGKVQLSLRNDNRKARAMWGTSRSLIDNMVKGVATGFTRELEINGVGYRAAVQGKELVLQLGYTHEIKYPIPAGVTAFCEKPTSIKITGPSRQQLGQMAAEIRGFRPPEPYKGKGVKYLDETIHRKEGKKK